MALYRKLKKLRPNISCIYTDANSCYQVAFKKMRITETHIVAKGKSQTHLIESSNSSIRDNLARFNRRTKKFSRSLEMLRVVFELFVYRWIVVGQ